MILFQTIALLGWFPFAVLLFAVMSPPRAIIAGYLIGTLFLPTTALEIFPFVPCCKLTVIPLGLVAGALMFANGPLLSLKARWIDLPIICYCLWPFCQLSNGVTPHDCCSIVVQGILIFGTPYALGRAYLANVKGARDLAAAIFIGGLVYIPPCLIEMRIGPELHRIVYGMYADPDYLQAVRMNGFRPVVFMQHGLMVGLFMMAATMCGFWLWWRGALPKRFGFVPMWFIVLVQTAATILTRSTGAIVLLIVGIGGLLSLTMLRRGLLLYLLVAVPSGYVCARILGNWDGVNLVQAVNDSMGAERAGSLLVRFRNERLLIDKALIKPITGWGPNGANNIYNSSGKIIVIPDGFWVILLGSGGIVALVCFYGALLLPMVALLQKLPRNCLATPATAAPMVLALIAVLFSIDCLANAMLNAIYILGIGSVAGIVLSQRPQVPQTRVVSNRVPQSFRALPEPGNRAEPSATY